MAYGSATRTLSYDHLGRLTEDVLADSGGTLTARHAYTHDDDGNVTSQVITLAGNAGEGTHTYAYDERNRLVTSPQGTHTYDRRGRAWYFSQSQGRGRDARTPHGSRR